MQTNRVNGEATIDIAQGREPARRIGLHKGGTPNHKIEAAEVEVGYSCLLRPNEADAQQAVQAAIELLELQEKEGHMLSESWTDSHSPIHLRAQIALLLWCRRMQARREAQGGLGAVAGLSKLDRLTALAERWFEYHYASLQLGRVPRGPLRGKILLPCNRKSVDDKKRGVSGGVSPGLVDDQVRRIWFSLVTPPGKAERTGKEFWTLSKDRQDTAAGPLAKLLLAEEGGFGPNLLRGTLPRLCAPAIADFYRAGHYIRFDAPLPGANRFTAKECWVEYDTGRYSFAGEPHPFSGAPLRTVRLAGPA